MATTVKHLTYDDLEAIPQEQEGDRHEIIGGRLFVTPAPIPYHQDVSRNIFDPLHSFVRARRLGKVYYAPVDVRLTPDNVVNPDIVFIARDRLHIVGPKTIDAAPDLIVEILSPGTRRRDLTVKRDLYARFGVREYWIVDPDSRTVEVFELVGDAYRLVPLLDGSVIQSRVLPDLRITLEMVFEDI